MSETLTLALPVSSGMRDLHTVRACLIENIVALHYLSVNRVPVFTFPGAALDCAMERLAAFQKKYGYVMLFADLDS